MKDYSPDSGTQEIRHIEKKDLKNKELEFTLTDPELAAIGRKAAQVATEISDLESQFSSLKDDWKARIKAKKVDLRDSLTALMKGKQVRRVDCEMVKDFNAGTVEYVFEGTVIETHAMTAEERQAELPMVTVEAEAELSSFMTKEEADANRQMLADAFRG